MGAASSSLPANTTKKRPSGDGTFVPTRSSDPLDAEDTLTLTRLMDGLSEISQIGNDNIGARGEQDCGTPFIKSPNTSVDRGLTAREQTVPQLQMQVCNKPENQPAIKTERQ